MKIQDLNDPLMESIVKYYYESLKLDETAHFNPLRHAQDHYQGRHAHVLRPGERFNNNDPKYPETVTFDEYVKAAEDLSDEPALPISDLKVDGKVYGFVIKRDKDPTPRIVKIRTRSVFNPKYMDVILYKDNKEDNQIFTFYLCRRDRLHRYDKNYIYDLFSQGGPDPLYENKTK